MKIYLASIEKHNIGYIYTVLFSYWDMINTIPFRKESWRIIIENIHGNLVARNKPKRSIK